MEYPDQLNDMKSRGSTLVSRYAKALDHPCYLMNFSLQPPSKRLSVNNVSLKGGRGTVAHHGTLLGSQSTYMKEAHKSA